MPATVGGAGTRIGTRIVTQIGAEIGDETDGQELRFPDGIPGFGHLRTFRLLSLGDETVFQLLQSTEEPDVSMVVVVPWLFFPDYEIELPEEERSRLGIERPEDAVVFCPVTLDAEHRTVYVNLVGPFVVNPTTRQGRQVVLVDSDHPLRAPVSLD